jgi:hypothetical protein
VITYVILLLSSEFCQMDLNILLINLSHQESKVAIFSQILSLSTLPHCCKFLATLKDKASLLICELSVLAQSVQTHYILAVLGLKGLDLDLRPLTLLWYVKLPVFLLFLLDFFLFFVPLLLCLLKFINLLQVAQMILDGLIERFFKEARVVI